MIEQVKEVNGVNILGEEQRIPEHVEDYVLLCGGISDPQEFIDMVGRIHAPVLPQWSPIVIVAAPEMREALEQWPESDSNKNTYVLFGHTRNRETLSRARLENAAVALVMGEPKLLMEDETKGISLKSHIELEKSKYEVADTETAMIALHLKSYYAELHEGRRHLHVGGELEDTQHRYNMVRLGVEDIVSTDALTQQVSVYAALEPSISYAFLELATTSRSSTEIYREKLPLGGKKAIFSQVVEAFAAKGKIAIGLLKAKKERAVTIGKDVDSSHEVLLHPTPETEVTEEDEALVIAYEPLPVPERKELDFSKGFKPSKIAIFVKWLWKRWWKRLMIAALALGALYLYWEPIKWRVQDLLDFLW